MNKGEKILCKFQFFIKNFSLNYNNYKKKNIVGIGNFSGIDINNGKY